LSEIRVGYSGLISFITGIMMVFTGLIFTIILTRNLSIEEYGMYNLIFGLIIYGLILDPIISYWATRETARNIQSQKTSIFFGSIFSIMGVGIYLIISYFLGEQQHVDQDLLFFGVILIPLMSMNRILNAINMGWKPQIVSYATFAIEISKVLMASVLIYFLDFAVMGIILALSFAQIASIIIQIFYAKEKIHNEIKIKFLKKWLKFSWIGMYQTLSQVLYRSDVIVFTIISESVIGIALFSVSLVISRLTNNSMGISSTAYGKLLENGKQKILQNNFTRLLYFAIPLSAISITFAKPGLFVLNPIYEIAFLIVIILTVSMFFRNINQTFSLYLLGIEDVDKNPDSKPKDFIKSNLFKLPTIRITYQIVYYLFLISGLLIIKQQTNEPLILASYWAIVYLINDVPYSVHLYLIIRKKINFKFEFRPIFKYFLTSLGVFGFLYFLIEEYLIYNDNIFVMIPNLILFTGIGVAMYLSITYMIDFKTRDLVQAILKEIKIIKK
jgi:hypothetical protein